MIYQLGTVTVDLTPKIQIHEDDYIRLQEASQELKVETELLKSKNTELAEQLRASGQTPDPRQLAESTKDENNPKWQKIQAQIEQLKQLINKSPVPSGQYARFLFLWNANLGEIYNKFEGKVFDECIEHNLVVVEGDKYYQLNVNHRRNERAISLMEEIERGLEEYLEENEPDPDDLFEWSLSAPEFWAKYLGLWVSA